jgi:hypothetical protein
MPDLFDATTLGAMRDVRRAFDPEERANPGKVVPVRGCREWRGGSRGRGEGSTDRRIDGSEDRGAPEVAP